LQGLDEFNLFDRHENYIFLQEVPRSTENWTLQKWIGNLQLPEMDWTTERAMHLWFAEAARSCQRCSPTWNVFNNVVRLSCPKMYSAAFCQGDIHGYPTDMDELANRIAQYLFRGSEEVKQIELGLLSSRRYQNVQLAADGYAQAIDIYLNMCARRGRHPVLGIQQIREGLVARLPLEIHQRLERMFKVSDTNLDELLSKALHLEAVTIKAPPLEAFQATYDQDNPMLPAVE